MKRIVALAAVAAFAFGIVSALSPVEAAKPHPGSCATVRCMACPPGYHLLLQWPNCCACIADR